MPIARHTDSAGPASTSRTRVAGPSSTTSPPGRMHGTSEFSTVRRRTDRATVQRVLGVNNAVDANDVMTVRRLDAKVWLLTGQANDELIIKLENPVGGETTQQFEHRHAHVTFLAQQALQGVPGASPLTQAELAEIAALAPAAVGNDVTDLQQFIAAPHGLVFLKVTKVNMGKNLLSRVDEANAALANPKGRAGLNAALALQAKLTEPAVLQSLGRMAAFDLVVNNADRFRPDGTVNAKNIDFSAGGSVIAIDNLDPNNRIGAVWQAQPHMTSRAAMKAWAFLAVGNLAEEISYPGQPMSDLLPDFFAGMTQAAATLKAQQGAMQARAAATADPHSQFLANEIARRLGLLP